MAFIPTPGVARVAMNYVANGQICVNTLWFRHSTGAPNEGELLVLANIILDWWKTGRDMLASRQVLLRDITVTSQESDSAPSITLVVPAADSPGGNITDASPNNVTLCVSFRTAGRGRSSRGRNYVVGVPDDATSGNQATPDYVTGCRQSYEALMGLASAQEWMWVVVSHQHNNQPLEQGLWQQVLSVIVVDANLDSQRRRLTGRGT